MRTVKPKSPRSYRQGRRQARTEETRARLVDAARHVLMSRSGPGDFSLETVARRAGVTRLTVYHQFGSRSGLLEAVYDDLAQRGRIGENLAAAFQQPDAEACLEATVKAFVTFWNAERLAIRRLRAMAVLDKNFTGATDRDQRRLKAMHVVVHRLVAQHGRDLNGLQAKAEVLAMLTSFEAFDLLAGGGAEPDKVLAILTALAHAALALHRADGQH
jgi:AcrR family transcriptional regulator